MSSNQDLSPHPPWKLTKQPLHSVLQGMSQRSVCTDSYEQGGAHPPTRLVHTLYCLHQYPEVEISGGGNQENQANEYTCQCLHVDL